MYPVLGRLQYERKRVARRIVWSIIGGVLLAAGFGFFGAALWIFLADQYSALIAALILGGTLTGAAIIAFLIGQRAPRHVPPPIVPETATSGTNAAMVQLVSAVLLGVSAGRALRRRG